MPEIDVRAVRREIKEAARRAFSRVRSDHPTDTFYAFALYSDGDGSTVCPSSNTEEAFARRVKECEPQRKELDEVLAGSGITFDDYMNYYRWGTSEWAHCYEGADQFETVSKLLNASSIDKAAVYGSMVLGLKDLDADGFFGTGEAREAVTILCGITDSLDAVWLGLESARLMNPPPVYQAFAPQWAAWQDEENRGIISNMGRRSACRAFRAFLRTEGVA